MAAHWDHLESFTGTMIGTWTPAHTNEIRVSGAGPQVMVHCKSLADGSDVEPGWKTAGLHKVQVMFQGEKQTS